MKLAIVAAAVIVSSAPARADTTTDACTRGIHYANVKKDLARAAMYLDLCEKAGPDSGVDPALVRRVHKQVEASDLSKLEIVTTPEGLSANVDAIDLWVPTPATFWVNAGRHELTFVRPSDGKTFKHVVDVKARTHVPIVLSFDEPVVKPPKDGHVDFRDDEPDVQKAPPPEQKHGSLLPCKYQGTCATGGGEELRDPFAIEERRIADGATARLRLGVRVGVGLSTGPTRGGYSIGAIGTFAFAPRFAAVARVDFVQRLGDMDALNAVALGGGVAARIATARRFALVVGADARGEVRFADAFAGHRVDRLGLAGDLVLDVVLRRVPLVVGARLEQGATPLIDGKLATAAVVELALELR